MPGRVGPAVVATASPAKVNLGLRITGKRPDGYHELWTVFRALAWGDDVHLRRRADREVVLTAAATAPRTEVPLDETNLATRAARSWLEATGSDWGLDLHLTKRIPARAGLGGGSSNAAAVLRLLESLAVAEGGRGAGAARLAELAAALGSDVPFFLRAGTQLGTGTGTDLTPVTGAPDGAVLLILPPMGCETRRVYENFRPQWIGSQFPDSVEPVSSVPFQDFAVPDIARNDLRDAAFAAYPELERLHGALADATGRADLRMSGSGSTLFLVDDTAESLERAAAAIRASDAAVGGAAPRLVLTSWGNADGGTAIRESAWPSPGGRAP